MLIEILLDRKVIFNTKTMKCNCSFKNSVQGPFPFFQFFLLVLLLEKSVSALALYFLHHLK